MKLYLHSLIGAVLFSKKYCFRTCPILCFVAAYVTLQTVVFPLPAFCSSICTKQPFAKCIKEIEIKHGIHIAYPSQLQALVVNNANWRSSVGEDLAEVLKQISIENYTLNFAKDKSLTITPIGYSLDAAPPPAQDTPVSGEKAGANKNNQAMIDKKFKLGGDPNGPEMSLRDSSQQAEKNLLKQKIDGTIPVLPGLTEEQDKEFKARAKTRESENDNVAAKIEAVPVLPGLSDTQNKEFKSRLRSRDSDIENSKSNIENVPVLPGLTDAQNKEFKARLSTRDNAAQKSAKPFDGKGSPLEPTIKQNLQGSLSTDRTTGRQDQ